MIGSFFLIEKRAFPSGSTGRKGLGGSPLRPLPCQGRPILVMQISAVVTNRLAKASV